MQWRVIPSSPNYEASDEGQIRNRTTGYVLKPYYSKRTGYAEYGPRVGKRGHQLVAEAFGLGDGEHVRHLDGNPANNRVDNLVPGTAAENNQDLLRHGRHGMASKTHCPAGHPYDEENTYINARGGRICRACRRAAQRSYRSRQTSAP